MQEISDQYEVVCAAPVFGSPTYAEDKDRWLRARRSMLTASDLPSILGLSPWRPAIEVYATKSSRFDESPDDVTEGMELGNEIEGFLLSALARRTRCIVEPGAQLLRSKEHPWMGCTLDGKILADGGPLLATLGPGFRGKRGAVEVKLSGAAFAGTWVSPTDDRAGFLPEHYRPQVTGQLAVSGAPFSVFAALLGGRIAYRWCVVARVEVEVQALIETAGAWWKRHVIDDVCPEPDGSDRAGEVLARLYPELGGTVNLPESCERDVQIVRSARDQIGDLEKAKKAAEQRLKLAIGSASSGRLPDGRVVSLSTIERKGFSVEPTSYRTLRLPRE